MAWSGRNQDRTACDELRALAQGWVFWIVGGLVTGTGLLGFGSFLLYHRMHPELAAEKWISDLRGLWGAPLGFGIVVVVHALDVARNRCTVLRILSTLQSEGRDPAPSGRAGKGVGL